MQMSESHGGQAYYTFALLSLPYDIHLYYIPFLFTLSVTTCAKTKIDQEKNLESLLEVTKVPSAAEYPRPVSSSQNLYNTG